MPLSSRKTARTYRDAGFGRRRSSAPAFRAEWRPGSLHLSGELRLSNAPELWHELKSWPGKVNGPQCDIDLSEVTALDGAALALIVELRSKLALRGIASSVVGARGELEQFVHLYHADEPPPIEAPAKKRLPFLESLGRKSVIGRDWLLQWLSFIGQLAHGAFAAIRHPITANLKAVLPESARAGYDAVGIVLLLNGLVGFAMAYQAAEQLEIYGANVYVADVVGISVTREIAPLITAIIASGRSGAAYAAEIGTMKVSEEIDALHTLGFAPVRYLVFPRVLALGTTLPVLTLAGGLVGMVGGAFVAAISLEVHPRAYFAQIENALIASDIWTGLVKSTAFGITVALVGCYEGFRTTGGASGVGHRTTKTIVQCLFLIVIIDTLFTILFRVLNV